MDSEAASTAAAPEKGTDAGRRIMAICVRRGCMWVRMRMPDGRTWEGDLPRELPLLQEGAGVVCPAHRPKIEARCLCRRRRIDGVWETGPLPRDMPLSAELPLEECPECTRPTRQEPGARS